MTNDTQTQRALRRYRQRRALLILAFLAYGVLCALAIAAQPGVLLIPGLILFGGACALVVEIGRHYRIRRYRRRN